MLKASFIRHKVPEAGMQKFGMIGGWLRYPRSAVWRMHIGSLVSAPWRRCEAFSVTRERGSSHWCGGGKNGLRGVWYCVPDLVRPPPAAGTGPALWRAPYLDRAIRGHFAAVPGNPENSRFGAVNLHWWSRKIRTLKGNRNSPRIIGLHGSPQKTPRNDGCLYRMLLH